ncbi:Sporulation protein YlmC, PRC-barrel domain family [Marinobacter gudaonensis]|uniref:Sporulation protein YlmC, PRC-barrel domain family n=1 Tax=Marinobacter gudaonensis TaxID=375760 RepID=A0A1I6GA14_9GAMM|nr:PRC-barrel domain-containing protein [Marinobacter gudaonensis]SFR39024.1 Sporulation protein YlmC, PRC-barrel domain family [Marinobacter gudaonensis]
MKKLHSLAFYALITPAITLGSGALLATQGNSEVQDLGEQSMGYDAAPEKQGIGQDRTVTKSKYNNGGAAGLTHQKSGDQPGMENRGYVTSVPPYGTRASKLIGTEVKTARDENVGSVNDLLIGQDGQIVAVVVGVGGFLGMGEKNVAISWDNVTRSGAADEQQLRIDQTREELKSAPDYKEQK